MKGGKKGLLKNSANLCARKPPGDGAVDGQNGKSADQRPLVAVSCKKAARRKEEALRARAADEAHALHSRSAWRSCAVGSPPAAAGDAAAGSSTPPGSTAVAATSANLRAEIDPARISRPPTASNTSTEAAFRANGFTGAVQDPGGTGAVIGIAAAPIRCSSTPAA